MTKKKKRLLIFSLLLLFSVVVLALGLKYFPFTKLVKMPAGSETAFANPEKVHNLSPHTLYYDFEVAPGKDMPGGFYKGLAHSGQYSVKAFGQNSFSVAVERTAAEVGLENLKAVAISAWIYVFPTKKDVKGSLVFTVSNETGVNVTWQGIGIVEPEIPRGKWFKISKYFDLSTVVFKPGYKIQVYFWNNSSTDILVDDYFIAFGGPVDRRGDSARVDMTKPAGFVTQFNYPPFPVSMLEKETLNKAIPANETDPGDMAIAGNFFNTGNDGLFAIRKDGRPVAFAFCPENREFRKLSITNPAAFAGVLPVRKILKGKFMSTQAEQFLIIGEKGWILGSLTPPENLCKGSGTLQTGLKILSKSDAVAETACAGDFNGDRRTEILWMAADGSWKLMSFEPTSQSGGAWEVMAHDAGNRVSEWNQGTQESGVSVGRFLAGTTSDVVLTVSRIKSSRQYTYTLRKFNASAGKWDPWFSEKQAYAGKTIGLDTLKPSDTFIPVMVPGGKTAIYRYNRDWRYDLKEIRFNDSTFNILSAVDFYGYDKGQNPKYYESLTLVPGCFLDPASGSVLAIGHVSKVRHYQAILPDFVHLYSLPTNK